MDQSNPITVNTVTSDTVVNNEITNKSSHSQSIKFNIDCWENIFDNLSLREILVMSQTCRQMCEIAGYYFRKHFNGISCDIISQKGFLIRWFQFKQTDFLQFIHTLNIYGQLFDYFNPLPNVDQYRSLTKLNLCFIDLSVNQVHGIKDVLNNLESVQLYNCAIYDGFLKEFFKCCPKLKCLSVNRVIFKSDTASIDLFVQQFGKLQYFRYIRTNHLSYKNGLLKTLLRQNPNIQYLELDGEDLWLNRNSLFGLNIQLNYLACPLRLDAISAIPFAHMLRTLHRYGFYKRFHLTVGSLPNTFEYQDFIDQMFGFNAFELLHSIMYVKLFRMTQLKEIYISGNRFACDMEELSINLTQLERLHICGARVEYIRPFLRHTKSLKLIWMISDLNNALNVYALNQEREQLEQAQKVSIGVSEDVYLATKQKFGQLNLQFVQIVRRDSIHFDHVNEYLQ